MGHASYRSLSKVSAVACYIASSIFLLAAVVLAFVTIVSPSAFPAFVFFAILAAAGIYAGLYFRKQCEVQGYVNGYVKGYEKGYEKGPGRKPSG